MPSHTVSTAKPVLFVDLSYYIFYRYYAVVNWYKLSQRKPPLTETILDDALFVEKYSKMFVESLKKLQKKHGVPAGNVVLVRDCVRGTIWRRQLFPDYKANRGDSLRDFNGAIFGYTYETLLPPLLETTGMALLGEACAEADDVIGVLKTKLRREHPDARIVILTNDGDYMQLVDDGTLVENLRGQNLAEKGSGDAAKDMLLKVLLGDASDNIPPVFQRRFSKKQAALLVDAGAEAIDRELEKDEGARERYERNRGLIDMARIPDELQRKIEALLCVAATAAATD
jgi:5'-3' exonuclease